MVGWRRTPKCLLGQSLLLGLLLLIALDGCRSVSPEEALLQRAFAAIRENNWQAFEPLTITAADFSLRGPQSGALREQQSFLSGVLRPQEKQRQREQFARAVAGGPGQMDFRRAVFVGMGRAVRSGHVELLEGTRVPYTVYSVRVRMSEHEKETDALAPGFAVVYWAGRPRLLGLEFSLPAAGGSAELPAVF